MQGKKGKSCRRERGIFFVPTGEAEVDRRGEMSLKRRGGGIITPMKTLL